MDYSKVCNFVEVENIFDAEQNFLNALQYKILHSQKILKLLHNIKSKRPLDCDDYTEDYILDNILDKNIFFNPKNEDLEYKGESLLYLSSKVTYQDFYTSNIGIYIMIVIDNKYIDINNGLNRKNRLKSAILTELEGFNQSYLIGTLKHQKSSDIISQLPINYSGTRMLFSATGFTTKDLDKNYVRSNQ